MGQQHLLTTVACETEFIHGLFLLRLLCGPGRAIVVGALAVGITLELLETALIVEPLVGEEIAAVHTAHRDDHLDMAVGLVNGSSGQFYCYARPALQ